MTTTIPTSVRILLLLALGLSGCAGGTDGAATAADVGYTRLTVATLEPGQDAPAPEGEVVLTLTGAIGTTNAGNTLELDIATLERLGTVEYEVEDDQALGRVATFQGVLLADLLAFAGAEPGWTSLETTALNDYAVTIPVADPATYPVLVATSVDGERMSVESYGPTRIMYPMGDPDLDPTIYNPRLIWQLDTIDVR